MRLLISTIAAVCEKWRTLSWAFCVWRHQMWLVCPFASTSLRWSVWLPAVWLTSLDVAIHRVCLLWTTCVCLLPPSFLNLQAQVLFPIWLSPHADSSHRLSSSAPFALFACISCANICSSVMLYIQDWGHKTSFSKAARWCILLRHREGWLREFGYRSVFPDLIRASTGAFTWLQPKYFWFCWSTRILDGGEVVRTAVINRYESFKKHLSLLKLTHGFLSMTCAEIKLVLHVCHAIIESVWSFLCSVFLSKCHAAQFFSSQVLGKPQMC